MAICPVLWSPGFFFLTDFILRESGKGGRNGGRETSMCQRNTDGLPLARTQLGTWPTTQARALTQICDLSVCRTMLD